MNDVLNKLNASLDKLKEAKVTVDHSITDATIVKLSLGLTLGVVLGVLLSAWIRSKLN